LCSATVGAADAAITAYVVTTADCKFTLPTLNQQPSSLCFVNILSFEFEIWGVLT